MSYPQAVIDQVVSHDAVMKRDPMTGEITDVESKAAYSETVEAHSVIEIELTSGQDYLIHIENIETVLNELKHPIDANDNLITPIGAEIGSWCQKKLDGSIVYGMLKSEDPSGKHVCKLYQSQLDRLKVFDIFRDTTSGNLTGIA